MTTLAQYSETEAQRMRVQRLQKITSMSRILEKGETIPETDYALRDAGVDNSLSKSTQFKNNINSAEKNGILKTTGKYSYYEPGTTNSDRITLNSDKVDLMEENFAVGERIRIQNLTKMQEFNNKEGSFRGYFPEKKRYELLLDDGSIIRLRRKNIIRLSKPQGQSFVKQSSRSSSSRNLLEEYDRLNAEVNKMRRENSSLKEEIKNLDGKNRGIMNGNSHHR
eukprot:CAMPEP_0184006738 /NCGR_PEP_ID=MMETSP0954-20121128/882_1 /TAXON_ID=627963 /ORGANISM="Aplanochytrium sp, Strain PBS07" /LENGTH=222 /DNA_ID=CAMNT_0026285365 /DNA_START=38 /DNA_END=705 /DNA_ORIENTATION=+